jgi:hypothetical protein
VLVGLPVPLKASIEAYSVSELRLISEKKEAIRFVRTSGQTY